MSCGSTRSETFTGKKILALYGDLIRLTFTANGKLQIFQGNFHTFSTAKLLIHASILMLNTVQIVLNSNTKLL